MPNQYSRMDEHGQEVPQIVTPPEAKLSITCEVDDHAVMQHEIECVMAREDKGLIGDDPSDASMLAQIELLEATRDRQLKALGELLQGHISAMSALSAALGSIGSIEAHSSHINDRLDALFFRAGQLTEDIARLRGITYEAPYSFTLLKQIAEEGEGTVVARIELRKPLPL